MFTDVEGAMAVVVQKVLLEFLPVCFCDCNCFRRIDIPVVRIW